jgi:hypothetical protein
MGRPRGGGRAEQGVRSTSTEQGQSATRVCCVVVPVGATINAQRYCDTLQNIRRAIKNKRPGKLSRGVLMLHDNARPHPAQATRDTLRHFGWGVLDHPPYSPDLSPCDYNVFGPLKETLRAGGSIPMRWFVRQWNSGSSSNPCPSLRRV